MAHESLGASEREGEITVTYDPMAKLRKFLAHANGKNVLKVRNTTI